jgi:hypothetical protein
MLIPFEDLAVVPARVIALRTLDLVSGTQMGAAFREIREKDLARLAIRALKQDVPFTGDKCAHLSSPQGMWAESFYTSGQDRGNTFFPRARLVKFEQLASLRVLSTGIGRATDRR